MKSSAGHRVLMLLENSSYPQDTRVHGEATALVATGYHVTVICPTRKGQPLREQRDGVDIYRYPAPPPAQSFLGFLWEYSYSMVATFLLSILVWLRRDFDVIHAANPPDTFVLIAAFYKLLGKRFVFDHHDLAPEMYHARFPGRGNRFVYQALILFEKLSCRLADHVIATNQSYKAIEMERGRVPEQCVTIVRNGPDLNLIRFVPPDPDIRQHGKLIIGYVGVIGFHDGVDYLLRALRHLVFDLGRHDFCCVLVGSGDAEPSLRVLARVLELTEYVRFTGWVDHSEVARYLSAMDICVAPEPSNPYYDNSTVIKMMEYMALAKPVVAFDLPEHRFTAQEAALYVRPNDELEFARGLAQLMDDPERRQAMGSFGRRRVERELAWCYSVPNLLDAYRAVICPRC
jgi:glycosyltransferase involved in cell wall biosynthesis